MMFFTEIFHLLVEKTNTYYQQHLNRQARSSHQLLDIMLPNMMIFVALALQMGHELTHYMTTCQDLDSYTICFTVRPLHETDFYTYCIFCILQTIRGDLMKLENMTDYGN